MSLRFWIKKKKEKKNNLISVTDCVTEKGTETTVTEASTTSDMITTKAIETEVVIENKAQNTATENEQTNHGMKEKYLKLTFFSQHCPQNPKYFQTIFRPL